MLTSTIALTILLSASGSRAAVIYGNDDLEGESAGSFSTTAKTTSYINTADSSSKVRIGSNLPSSGDTSADPSGQHIEIAGNRNKHFTQVDPMTLLSDGV